MVRARVRVVGGVIFEGRADKPLGVVGDKPYPGRGKFRQNARRGEEFLRCALRGKKVLAKTCGGARVRMVGQISRAWHRKQAQRVPYLNGNANARRFPARFLLQYQI